MGSFGGWCENCLKLAQGFLTASNLERCGFSRPWKIKFTLDGPFNTEEQIYCPSCPPRLAHPIRELRMTAMMTHPNRRQTKRWKRGNLRR